MDAMLNIVIIAVALGLSAWFAFSPRLRNSSGWQATVTPLASIMGSGFLISAPLLAGLVGNFAVFAMALLLLLAYAVGGAIRFNILRFEPVEVQRGPVQAVALLSRLVLVVAYFVSISYYLQLLAAFVLHMAGLDDPRLASWFTTVMLALIGGIGAWRGLAQMEHVEKYAVSLNLGMIGALLFALVVHNGVLIQTQAWQLAPLPSAVDFTDMRILLGLLIVVQGFETSRYLGSTHPRAERISTMRRAQIIAAAVYIPFIGLTTVLFHSEMDASVTEIINLMLPVASVLPIMLAITAIGSQFSAAVADMEGASGLLEDLTHHALPVRAIYLLITLITIALVWETNVYQIIAYASRAFALFYMLQCIVAAMMARKQQLSGVGYRCMGYSALAVICGLVFVLGLPSE